MESSERIYGFSGPYRFLSNFWLAQVEFEGRTYGSTENAYQAAKTHDPEIRNYLANLSPGAAKKHAKLIQIRPDWHDVRYDIMLDLNRQKYKHKALRELLINTGNREILEFNEWDDRYWGVIQVAGFEYGENNLGKILMQIREEIKRDVS